MEVAEQLRSGLTELGLTYPDNLVERAIAFQTLILKWNRVTNLTSITDPAKIVSHHLLDSFSVQSFIPGGRIVDVGSGAGLPGIPLALINPDKNFILLDANGKKTRFMTQVKIELELTNVEVVQSRVEDFEGEFDHVVSRAFRSLNEFVEACGHLAGDRGNLLAMKGPDYEFELQAAGLKDFETTVHSLFVPGIDAERYLVELEKDKSAEPDPDVKR